VRETSFEFAIVELVRSEILEKNSEYWVK